MARRWAFIRIIFGRGELRPPSRKKGGLTVIEFIKPFAAAAWQKIREGWKAVVALATPILLAAIGDVIDVVGDYIELEYGTSAWVGVISMALVWLKRNVEPGL